MNDTSISYANTWYFKAGYMYPWMPCYLFHVRFGYGHVAERPKKTGRFPDL